MIHTPVLQKEVLLYLNPGRNENFVDATIGGMGYTAAILEKNKPNGKILGIELDPEIIKKNRLKLASEGLYKRIVLVNDSYINLEKVVKKNNFRPINGILFDLGMSSWHLEKSGRGFSFLRNEPLDMRFKTADSKQQTENNLLTAGEIINHWPEEELEKIFREYGEEKFSSRIAKKICEERKEKQIETTFQLVEVIKKTIPSKYLYGKIHFATRTFQALRITVNDELNNLKKVLPQTLEVLAKKGRIVVISFHSLEDRIVKNFLKDESKKKLLKVLTKKPITPNSEEIKINHRSRSAKLRACQKF